VQEVITRLEPSSWMDEATASRCGNVWYHMVSHVYPQIQWFIKLALKKKLRVYPNFILTYPNAKGRQPTKCGLAPKQLVNMDKNGRF
jgi:hypothetical protein